MVPLPPLILGRSLPAFAKLLACFVGIGDPLICSVVLSQFLYKMYYIYSSMMAYNNFVLRNKTNCFCKHNVFSLETMFTLCNAFQYWRGLREIFC